MALPIVVNDLVAGLTKAVQSSETNNEGGSFLKMNKAGYWIYGSDDIETEDGSQWGVNPSSFATGFIAWGDSEVLGEEMASVMGDPIIKANLPDVGATWQQQVAMQLVCVSGEDKGEQVLFKSSSHGGRKRFNDFLQQVIAQLTSGNAGDKVVPVIELDSDSYKHKSYGKIYQPIFSIKSWATQDATLETVDDEPAAIAEPEPEPEPKRKRRARRAA